jgi:hypothetical protein
MIYSHYDLGQCIHSTIVFTIVNTIVFTIGQINYGISIMDYHAAIRNHVVEENSLCCIDKFKI